MLHRIFITPAEVPGKHSKLIPSVTPFIPVVTDFRIIAVVDKAGRLIVNEFELSTTVLYFNALLLCDTNVSVEGKDEICKVL